MRKILFVIPVAAATLIATAQLAVAAPHQDRVFGIGSTDTYEARVNVISGPTGEHPRGSFSIQPTNGQGRDWRVPVTCLHVAGSTAIVGGWDSEAKVAIFLTIQDNGETGDQMRFTGAGQVFTKPPESQCKASIPRAAEFSPVISGDFTATDV